jgi:hypothetical protein
MTTPPYRRYARAPSPLTLRANSEAIPLAEPSPQRPAVTLVNGGAEHGYSVDDLMNEVFDLMCRRLPRIGLDDPRRLRVMALLPTLANALGRDPLGPA